EEVQPRQQTAQLIPRLSNRLTDLERQRARQLLAAFVYQITKPLQHRLARARLAGGPAALRGARAIEQAGQPGDVVLHRDGRGLTGCGIDDVHELLAFPLCPTVSGLRAASQSMLASSTLLHQSRLATARCSSCR